MEKRMWRPEPVPGLRLEKLPGNGLKLTHTPKVRVRSERPVEHLILCELLVKYALWLEGQSPR